MAYQVQCLQFAGGTEENISGESFFEAEIQTHHFLAISDIHLFSVVKYNVHLSFSCSIEPEDSDDEDDLSPWRRGSVSSSARVLAGRMSSELKARLDTPVVTPRTMGILSSGSKSTNSTPSAPTGHRIVVSNLQTSVTQEDIRVNCPVPPAQIVIAVCELDFF
jgi:hypothetical protein